VINNWRDLLLDAVSLQLELFCPIDPSIWALGFFQDFLFHSASKKIRDLALFAFGQETSGLQSFDHISQHSFIGLLKKSFLN
jgi:hypothetical protein